MYEGNKKKTIILSQNNEMTCQSNEANDLSSSSCYRAFFRLEKSKDYVEPVLIRLRII